MEITSLQNILKLSSSACRHRAARLLIFGYVTASMEGGITDWLSRNQFSAVNHTVLPNFVFNAKISRDCYIFSAVLF
jgi:hypothetical protein